MYISRKRVQGGVDREKRERHHQLPEVYIDTHNGRTEELFLRCRRRCGPADWGRLIFRYPRAAGMESPRTCARLSVVSSSSCRPSLASFAHLTG